MRVLVVGGNGFIGSHVVDALLTEGVEVSVLDKSPERFRSPQSKVQYFRGSFGNAEDVETALETSPSVVIHLGNYDLSLDTTGIPESDLRNLDDSVKLFGACVKRRVAKVIFMSTGGKIYGITDRLPVRESDPTNPLGSYAIMKLCIEKHLMSLSHYYGIDAVILRPSNPYGVRQSPLGKQGVVAIFGWRILHREPITIWGSGEAVRDYIDVRDIARFCCLAATNSCDGIFNLGSGIGVGTNELVKRLTEVLGITPIIKREPARRFDVPAIVLDSTRARLQFDWKPRTDLRAGLDEVASWLRHLAHDGFGSELQAQMSEGLGNS
jgi:UDP-glucose 4-epimerase